MNQSDFQWKKPHSPFRPLTMVFGNENTRIYAKRVRLDESKAAAQYKLTIFRNGRCVLKGTWDVSYYQVGDYDTQLKAKLAATLDVMCRSPDKDSFNGVEILERPMLGFRGEGARADFRSILHAVER